jgi:outer membrane protein assembly factor BamB
LRTQPSRSLGLLPAQPSGWHATAQRSTTRPPWRCSRRISSKRASVTPPYQTPSGYTTTHGPPLHTRKHPAFVRITATPVSRTRRFTHSQSASPSSVPQHSGPMQTNTCRCADPTPAFASPALTKSELGFSSISRYLPKHAPPRQAPPLLSPMRSLFLLLSLALPCAGFAAPWPEFLGPNRDNSSPETGLRQALSPAGAPILWKARVGTGYSAPSVWGNQVVLHHRLGNEEIVESFDAQSGASQWKYAYPTQFIDPFGYNNGPRCSPLLTGEICYTLGAEGVLCALRQKDGSLLWRRELSRDFDVPEAFFGVGSSPILEDGRLLVMVGGQPNSGVVAFDAQSGKTLWQNGGANTWNGVPMTGWPGERLVEWNPADPAYQKQASYCTPVLATFHGKRHALCVTRQGLLSLDPATGERRFAYWFRARQDSSVNAMTPVVQGDCILLSSAYFKNGSVLLRVAPDGNSVEPVWRGLQLEMHWARPILHQNHLFAFSGRNEPDARFRCVDWTSGQIRWDREEGWPNGGHAKLRPGEKPPDVFGRASLLFADQSLVALGECGLLGLFAPDSEKLVEKGRWQVPGLQYPCWTGPVLSEKRLYLRDESLLLCIDWKAP